ncbi:MAG: UDP-2,3-diacylglucosamine diphosphatase [Woeseiaceae bacterium]
MQRAYFVSDLHITSPDDDRARLFIGFLRSLKGDRDLSHLFLMGDVFDLWLAAHAYFVDRYRTLIDEFVRLRDEGTQIHYFEGNHDLHLRRFWEDELGMTVHEGPIYLELCGRTLRLEHGDQMDRGDRGYRFLRWFLRTPPIRFLICHLPGALVARLGERASAASRAYTSETKTLAADVAIRVIRRHAERANAAKPYDLLVSGHLHVRDDHTFHDRGRPVRSVNLGSWLDRPCCLRVDAKGIRLVELTPSDMSQSCGDSSHRLAESR